MEIIYNNTPPALDEYQALRAAVRFNVLSDRIAARGIANPYFIITARAEDGRLVGMARLLSDGGYVNYITDVMVHPKFQGKGIGKTMVNSILSFLRESLLDGEKLCVYLMAAKGKEPFYEKFGFLDRPTDDLGAGMSFWVKK